MTWLLILGLFFFFALNVPFAFAMLLTSIIYLLVIGDVPLVVVAQRVAVGTDAYLLLAIPFFFLAAELMNSGGIMERLVRLAQALVGHVRGGLGHVNVLSSMLFAGISGSAVADVAGLGRLELEMMRKGGYDRDMAAAITGASATIGPIIPPSIPLVLYAGIAEVSVGRLFLGGVVPGLLMATFLMAAVYRIARRRNYPKEVRVPAAELLRAVGRSIPILVLPFIILGGILSGAFTPTEASVVAAAYALAVGALLLRGIRWPSLGPILVKVGADTARLMFIIASASLFGWILAREGVPQALAAGFLAVSQEPWAVLLMINVLLFLLGCFMEPLTVMVILVPIFLPLIQQLGIDPVHFGVVVTLNLMIGLITPPVGMVMFVIIGLTNISIERFARAVLPFLGALVLVLLLVTYVPSAVLFLPDLIMGAR